MTDRADVELRLPADGAFSTILRTTTAGLAARLDFTIEDIEDARIAVAEATAMLLEVADEGADLVARFRLAPGELAIAVGVAAQDPGEPDYDSFAWQVLDTLSSGASVEVGDGSYTIGMTMTSSAPAAPGSPGAD